jgi:hypothetical protein
MQRPMQYVASNQKLLLKQLRWTLTSPSLLSHTKHPYIVPDSTCQQWFDQLKPELYSNDLITSFNEYITKEQVRGSLGDYFERSVQFLIILHSKHLSQSSNTTEVYPNIRISCSRDKVTKGDLDVVFYNGTQWVHWETAIKNYLYFPNEYYSALGQFIGPHSIYQDTLEKKVSTFQQISNLTNSIVTNRNSEFELRPDIPKEHLPISSQLFIKGIIFYPYNMWKNKSYIEVSDLNPHHWKGWFIRYSPSDPEYNEFKSSITTTRLVILEKDDAIGRFSTKRYPRRLNQFFEIVKRHFSNSDIESARALLISEVAYDDEYKVWLEVSRGFIVAEKWPWDIGFRRLESINFPTHQK